MKSIENPWRSRRGWTCNFPFERIILENISILHLVIFSLRPHFPLLLGLPPSAEGNQFLHPDHFRADEPLGKIAMHTPSRLNSRRSLGQRPSTNFALPRRSSLRRRAPAIGAFYRIKCDEVEDPIRGADNPVKERLRDTDHLSVLQPLCLRQLCQFLLDLGADHNHIPQRLLPSVNVLRFLSQLVFGDIENREIRLGAEKRNASGSLFLFVWKMHGSDCLSPVDSLLIFLDDGFEVLVLFLGLFQTSEDFQILELQFCLHRLKVPRGIKLTRDMCDIGVLECPQEVADGVNAEDVGEEGVPQPLPLMGTSDQSRDIDKGDACRSRFARMKERAQFLKSRIGNRRS